MQCSIPDILDTATAVQVFCSNPFCWQSGLVHPGCFYKWEDRVVRFLVGDERRGSTDQRVGSVSFKSIGPNNQAKVLSFNCSSYLSLEFISYSVLPGVSIKTFITSKWFLIRTLGAILVLQALVKKFVHKACIYSLHLTRHSYLVKQAAFVQNRMF